MCTLCMCGWGEVGLSEFMYEIGLESAIPQGVSRKVIKGGLIALYSRNASHLKEMDK